MVWVIGPKMHSIKNLFIKFSNQLNQNGTKPQSLWSAVSPHPLHWLEEHMIF